MLSMGDDTGSVLNLEADDVIGRVRFDDAGLVPAIAQDADSRQVLMMAWMDEAALRATLASHRATYFSRSRQRQWVKGETSGHVQTVRELRLDCDGDTLLLIVNQQGAACHTGAVSCFDVGGANDR
jgi:phosphoribosyl-AMP cyclohydrolase